MVNVFKKIIFMKKREGKMRQLVKKVSWMIVLAMMVSVLAGITVSASDDNSLADLGITTEGVTVSPDFVYSTWTYDVTVPAGTTELALSPVPSSDSATIAEISGTTLNEDGTGTVYITVQAQSGARFTYTLNVTGGGALPEPETAAPETQPATEAAPQTEAPVPQTEPQTEDSRFVRVDKNTIQEAENTITSLKNDIATYRDTISLYTKIMYGLIAVAVLLLFLVINLILRKRDLKAELNDYRSLNGKNTKKKKGKKDKGTPTQGGQTGRGTPFQGQTNAGGRPPQNQQGAPQGQVKGQNAQQNGPQGQVSGQIRNGQIQYRTPGGGLDVQPQTSSRRRLPEYQKEDMTTGTQPGGAGNANAQPAAPAAGSADTGAAAQQTPAGQTGPAVQPEAGQAPHGEHRNVEVDMIEL